MKIIIIGISDQKQESIALDIHSDTYSDYYFSGGKRHHQLVTHLLPEDHTWLDITIPMEAVYENMRQSGKNWIVFASGDPLFFGIGITFKRIFPEALIDVHPYFNSLQLLAHNLALPYGLFRTVTLTGRDWNLFDKALMQAEQRLGILTDRKKTPTSIAQRMLDYGFDNYRLSVGELMGGENQRVRTLSVKEAAETEFNVPNCFYLEMTQERSVRRCIPEEDFEGLEGRPKMITKMPIRMATLAYMELEKRSVFWDVGACTGSVSIDARLSAPHLKQYAFEIRPESDGIIHRNMSTFQTPGIEVYIDDYLAVEKDDFQAPDAVFLGGYGGKMEVFLDDIDSRLLPEGIIAFNAVSEKSYSRFVNWAEKNDYTLQKKALLALDEHNPINILVIRKG